MKHVPIVAICLVLAGLVGACAGFDLGDLVRVKTPHEVRLQTGAPQSMTVNEAEASYRAYLDAARPWRENIEDGQWIVGTLNQLALDQVNALGPSLGGVPVVGPVLVGALPLATYLFGAGRVRKEKEASYNAGLKQGKRLATETGGG